MAAERKTRRFRVNQIQVLQAEHKTIEEISEHTGLSRHTILDYIRDPTGEYRRVYANNSGLKCVICGGRRSRKATTGRCRDCNRQILREQRLIWTKERILKSIHAFNENYGRPPAQNDFVAYTGDGRFPHPKTVYREFGSWGNAIVAAGFPRPKRGGYHRPLI